MAPGRDGPGVFRFPSPGVRPPPVPSARPLPRAGRGKRGMMRGVRSHDPRVTTNGRLAMTLSDFDREIDRAQAMRAEAGRLLAAAGECDALTCRDADLVFVDRGPGNACWRH